ncbi:MAG: 5-(carboxyamino)imidazole ribonucleotide synthase [Phycisphaeraceae bacterium]
MSGVILPGATIGVLGGGQLGRMLSQAAKRMGYRVHVFDPGDDPPAAQVSDAHTQANWDDDGALRAFAGACDRVTLEWENIPLATARAVDEVTRLLPSPAILEVAQDRAREKSFLAEIGCPLPDVRVVDSADDFDKEPAWWDAKRVLKTSAAGYDGKGQLVVTSLDEAKAGFAELGRVRCVAEAWVPYEREVSVIVARGMDGAMSFYGPIWNRHANHILDVSVYPSGLSEASSSVALGLVGRVAERLTLVGVLCVEMFVLGDGSLMVNELAPRPHNSGHVTIEACATSQFEQHLRAVAGLPLGDVGWRGPAAMVNLLGDLWVDGEPAWLDVLGEAGVSLHLYGKHDPRVGRKMGHLTALGATASEAERCVVSARSKITDSGC